jgi:hypothetical protein
MTSISILTSFLIFIFIFIFCLFLFLSFSLTLTLVPNPQALPVLLFYEGDPDFAQ